MNIKTLGILIVVAALLVFAAVNTNRNQQPADSDSAVSDNYKQPVFPDLAAKTADIAEINLKRQDADVTLVKTDGTWGVKDKANYPADLEKIGKLLLGIADLRYLEAKTSSADLYDKLDLQDLDKDGSQTVQVTLTSADGAALATLLVGKQKVARMDSTRKEIYVRKPGDAQAWLVLGTLPVEYDKQPTDWIQRDILDIPSQRISSVDTQQGADRVSISRAAGATDFTLADIPANGKVKVQYEVNNIANSLAGLRLDDVVAAAEVDFSDAKKAVFQATDGLQVVVESAEKDGKAYARFSAAYVEQPKPVEAEKPEGEQTDAKPEEAQKSAEEVQKEVDSLNAKLSDWAFELPSYKLDSLFKKQADLISLRVEEKAPEPGAATQDLLTLPPLDATATHSTIAE